MLACQEGTELRPYSMDLRERVVAACDRGDATRRQVAERFCVSVAWVCRLLQRRRETGSIAPKTRGGGHPPAFDAAAAEQDRPELKVERQAWRAEFAAIDPHRLVFLDETGATTKMTRLDGRAPRGRRVHAWVPHGHWKVVTLTAAVRLGGVGGCLAFDGATDTPCFETYVEPILAPTLRPQDIVVMDNLGCHKTAEVGRLIRSMGAEVRYLPAYSPDLNPIEMMFSKVKASLRSASARTIDSVFGTLGDGLRAVTEPDIAGWFKKCGYVYTQP